MDMAAIKLVLMIFIGGTSGFSGDVTAQQLEKALLGKWLVVSEQNVAAGDKKETKNKKKFSLEFKKGGDLSVCEGQNCSSGKWRIENGMLLFKLDGEDVERKAKLVFADNRLDANRIRGNYEGRASWIIQLKKISD